MGQLVNDTLSAWLLIESLNPGEVSYTTDDLLSQKHFKNIVQQVQLHSFDEYYDIWNDERFIISDEMNKQGDRVYKFYRNCFRYNQINLKIQDILTAILKFSTPMLHIAMVIHLIQMRMETSY